MIDGELPKPVVKIEVEVIPPDDPRHPKNDPKHPRHRTWQKVKHDDVPAQ